MAAPGKLGALSTILWLSVLFGGYLGAVSAIWRSLVLFECDLDFLGPNRAVWGLFWGCCGSLGLFRGFQGFSWLFGGYWCYLGAARNIMVPLGPLLLFGGYFGTIPAYKG